MGSSPKRPKAQPVPPIPEPVKYMDAERAKARSDASAAAAKRYGVSGTNVTGGLLGDENAQTKKKTLGGQ